MWYNKRLLKVAATIFFISVFAFGCSEDSTGPAVDPETPPPSFTISSVVVQLQGGNEGLQFFARGSSDCTIGRVNLTSPLGDQFVFNANNNLFLTNELMALQNTNQGYVRISGSWTFRFVGNHNPGGEGFDVTQVLSVGAKELAD
jgi:hypothetical protein